jgi:hypothetical protein
MSIYANTTYALKHMIWGPQLANGIFASAPAPYPADLSTRNMEGQVKYSLHLRFAVGLGLTSWKSN